MMKEIGGVEFALLGTLRLTTDPAGQAIEYVHSLPSGVEPNRYAAGPFCAFELVAAPHASGVYAFTVGDELTYIGEAEDVARRFGPTGYGRIVSRNVHSDGQSTNCKINALVLQAYKTGEPVKIWFAVVGSERKTIEARLIAKLTPPWNGSMPSGVRHKAEAFREQEGMRPDSLPTVMGTPTNKNRFESALDAAFAEASRFGKASLRVRSGDLHREVGGYPGASHQMPDCCRVMRAAMMAGDQIVESPPKGAGANLVIEYRLPRDGTN
jgi:5-methylcytosine-specific restriction protein A